MVYRPKYKNADGTSTDLPLDAETVRGTDVIAALVGKSNTGHKHSASDITSGTLAVSRGGTGVASYSALAGSIRGYLVSAVTGTGTITVTLANSTEYRYTNVSSLTMTYPSGNFECWIRMTVRSGGTATVSFPTGTTYIGEKPSSFAAGKTYEISIKDKIAVIGEVG